MKKLLLLTLAFLIVVSCQTKEEKTISSFKKEINKEYKIYNSYISDFKNSLKDVRIKEFDVIANDSTPREYLETLNDYWMFKPSYENILQKISAVERNISIADSISTKIITLNDSLVKYNVKDSLINLKLSQIKGYNKKILQAKYYNTEVKKLLKLKDDFFNTLATIGFVNGGWKTSLNLMNKQSRMEFYRYKGGYRFMVRYEGILTDGYSIYKKKTSDEVYDLSNPNIYEYLEKDDYNNHDDYYVNILEWKATGFSSSYDGGRISYDKNFGKGSKLRIKLSDKNGYNDKYGNYIRYWFGNDSFSCYGTYKLEGKQKNIVQDFLWLKLGEKPAVQNIEKSKFSNKDKNMKSIAEEQGEISNKVIVNVDNLNFKPTHYVDDPDGWTNLRDKPKGSIIKRLDNKSECKVLSKVNGWLKVDFQNGDNGYIHSSRLKPIKN